MSIILNVEEYCQNCKSFKPSVGNRTSIHCGNKETVNTVVECKNKQRCQCMFEKLKERMKETKN